MSEEAILAASLKPQELIYGEELRIQLRARTWSQLSHPRQLTRYDFSESYELSLLQFPHFSGVVMAVFPMSLFMLE